MVPDGSAGENNDVVARWERQWENTTSVSAAAVTRCPSTGTHMVTYPSFRSYCTHRRTVKLFIINGTKRKQNVTVTMSHTLANACPLQ